MTSEEYSQQLQEKFELYLLALVFTILGLAIQTAKFGQRDIADVFELIAWALLVISGIAGLSRLEWLPVAHKNHGALTNLNQEREDLSKIAAAGVQEYPIFGQDQPAPIQQLIDDRNLAIVERESLLKAFETSTIRKYAMHKWCFFVAIILLACARGYPATESLVMKHFPVNYKQCPATAAVHSTVRFVQP